MYELEELEVITRLYMLDELEKELSKPHFVEPSLSADGRTVWEDLLREAIIYGDEATLKLTLLYPKLWQPRAALSQKGADMGTSSTFEKMVGEFACHEFNTWYIRGMSRRLMDEGENECRVYRAERSWEPQGSCLHHDGKTLKVQDIYEGHRARYWPKETKGAFSIPFDRRCHHTIGRIER